MAAVEIESASFGEGDTAGCALDEANTEAGFEAADGPADARFRHTEVTSSLGKAACAGYLDEKLKAVEVVHYCSLLETVYCYFRSLSRHLRVDAPEIKRASTEEETMYLITGATGNVGSQVVTAE